MSNPFVCTIHLVTGRSIVESKVSLEEITAGERQGKELLGKAVGQDLTHCVYLGIRYCKGFVERAKWYYVSQEPNSFLKALRQIHHLSAHVEFYGERK